MQFSSLTLGFSGLVFGLALFGSPATAQHSQRPGRGVVLIGTNKATVALDSIRNDHFFDLWTALHVSPVQQAAINHLEDQYNQMPLLQHASELQRAHEVKQLQEIMPSVQRTMLARDSAIARELLPSQRTLFWQARAQPLLIHQLRLSTPTGTRFGIILSLEQQIKLSALETQFLTQHHAAQDSLVQLGALLHAMPQPASRAALLGAAEAIQTRLQTAHQSEVDAQIVSLLTPPQRQQYQQSIQWLQQHPLPERVP